MEKKDFSVNNFLFTNPPDMEENIVDMGRLNSKVIRISPKSYVTIDGGRDRRLEGTPFVGLIVSAKVKGTKKVDGFAHEWGVGKDHPVSDINEVVDIDSLLKNMIALDHLISTMPKLKKDSLKLHQVDLVRDNLEAIVRGEKPAVATELVLGTRVLQQAIDAAIQSSIQYGMEHWYDPQPDDSVM